MTPKVEGRLEAGIREGKRLRIGFLERDLQAVGFGTLATTLKKRADVVRRNDVGEAACRGERCIAISGATSRTR